MTVYTIRPDGQTTQGSWTGDNTDVDEEHSQPSDVGDGNRTDTQVADDVCVMTFSSPSLTSSHSVSQIKVWALTEVTGDPLISEGILKAYYNIGAGYSAAKNISGEAGGAETWYSGTWDSLSEAGDDIDDLVIKLEWTESKGTPRIYVDVLYVEITATLPELTNSDVLDGTITQSEMGYQKATFRLKKGTTVVYDQAIKITEEYTDHDGTSTTTIFEGFIQDYSLTDVKEINAVAKGEEVAKIQPKGRYEGLTSVRMSQMISDYADYISTSYGSTTWDGYWKSTYNFSSETGRTNDDITYITERNGNTLAIESKDDGEAADGSVHNDCLKITGSGSFAHHTFSEKSSGTVEFWVMDDDVSANGFAATLIDDDDNICAYIYTKGADSKIYATHNGGDTVIYNTALTDDHWYRIKLIFNGDDTWDVYLYDNDLSALGNVTAMTCVDTGVKPTKFGAGGNTGKIVWLDAVGFSWDAVYDVGDNAAEITYTLPATTYIDGVNLNGGNTLQSMLTEGAMLEKDVWTLAPDGDVRWHDTTDDSGVSITSTSNIWGVTGNYQVKRYNRVVLKGALGLESIANNTTRQDTSGQIIIFKDYRPNVTSQAKLDVMATQLLSAQQDPPLQVSLKLEDATSGWIQVGETVSIGAGIKYNNSSNTIAAGDYRIVSETYRMKNGAYHYIELTLEDALIYKEQKTDEKIDNTIQNSNYGTDASVTTGSASGINNVIEDSSPQLGGNLDVNTKNITSPDGTDLIDIDDGSIDIQTNSSSRLDITDSGVRLGAANARVTTVLDEDAMGSDSATALVTQQSVKAYVDALTESIWTDDDNDYKYYQDIVILTTGYDYTDLLDAITRLNTAGGGILYIPEGSCTITSQIDISAAIQVYGTGDGAIWLSDVSGDRMILVSGNDASFHNIMFQVDNSTDHSGVEVTGNRVQFDHCYFNSSVHGTGNGLYIDGRGTRVINCQFTKFDNAIYINYGAYCLSYIAFNTFNDPDVCIRIDGASDSSNLIFGNYAVSEDEYMVNCDSDRNIIIGNDGNIIFNAGADENIAIGNQNCTLTDNGSNNVTANNNA